MERLTNKVALVSGAASGIGAAVVDRMTAEGATVVAADIAEIDDGVTCNVTDPESCAAAIAEALERHDQLDIVVNVAGIGAGGRIEDVTPQEWHRVIQVNLTGTFLLSQAALPALLESRGVIVNMASLAGVRGTPYNAAYSASKGGVIALTKSMAVELASTGVRVNAVCPGAVNTPFLSDYHLPEDADMTLLQRSMSPLGGLVEADEVPCARSPISASVTVRPRPAASRAMPQPLMPPPMMKRSTIGRSVDDTPLSPRACAMPVSPARKV